MADYSDFELKEYENISNAHFKTNEMIIAFFRFYLLIMALPITAFGAAVTFTGSSDLISTLPIWRLPVGIMLCAFSILGFMIMLYINGLRAKALLYARQVNAVRDYFFSVEERRIKDNILSTLVLPRDASKPKINTSSGHKYIVSSFVLIDALYLAGAVWVFLVNPEAQQNGSYTYTAAGIHLMGIIGGCFLWMGLHWSAFEVNCEEKEKEYNDLLS